MEVKDKVMYHYHKQGIYDNFWNVGNEIIVDNNFRSYFSKILDDFTTGVPCKNDKISSFDRVISYYLKDDIFETVDKELAKQMLLEAKQIIYNTNVCRREFALEQIRKEFYPHLPSRLHSIWLTDDENIDFWKEQLVSKETLKNNPNALELYKVNITGNLFKSSDYFIPNDEVTMLEMMEQAKKYWNPDFINVEKALNGTEYLFQGKLKILRRIDNIQNN